MHVDRLYKIENRLKRFSFDGQNACEATIYNTALFTAPNTMKINYDVVGSRKAGQQD